MVTPLRSVQPDIVEAIHASRDKAERHARYRAIYCISTNSSLAHWQIEERVTWLRWFMRWEPLGIAGTKEEAQQMLDRLEHEGTIWPRM